MSIWTLIVLLCFLFAGIGGFLWGYLEKKSEAAELRRYGTPGDLATDRRDSSEDPTIPFG